MANKDWYETFVEGDCVRDYVTWNDMAIYIQHSACTDFTIYGLCTDTGQAFRFSQANTESYMYGGADGGDDLIIFANDTDSYPSLTMLGDGNVIIDVTDEKYVLFREGNREYFRFDSGANLSILQGGTVAGDDLTVKANNADTYPFIDLLGGAEIELEVANEEEIIFKEGGSQFFSFERAGASSIFYGGTSTSDDLLIYVNTTDLCPAIELYGNEGMVCLIEQTHTFEVSTCTDETLFEVDNTPTDKHVDFHCLDAHNFVLELRTSDAPSPTCLGRIWFRTDL